MSRFVKRKTSYEWVDDETTHYMGGADGLATVQVAGNAAKISTSWIYKDHLGQLRTLIQELEHAFNLINNQE